MTFFEQELRKIVGAKYPDATFVGRVCYVPLSDTNRAKIHFATCGTADHHEALQLTILNRNDGQVDSLTLRFKDVLGVKKVANPNFRDGVKPHAWTYRDKTEWYAYLPTSEDYRKLTNAVSSYLTVFRAPEREAVKDNPFIIQRPTLGRRSLTGNIITISVCKDALGFPEKDDFGDNLTEISVPKAWLVAKLLNAGDTLDSWLQGPPDDDIAMAAIREGVLLDCADPEIKRSLFGLQSPSLDNMICDAQSRGANQPPRTEPPTKSPER